jgi:2-polyprenyl-6-methoxyphenol hydroxylase-like FAD-dependent oxidoreductase
MRRIRVQTPQDTVTLADFSHLKTRYPYITMLPQVKFLEFITQEAQKYPNFRLVMGANVQELIPSILLRLLILRDLPAQLIALGVFPVHVQT